MQFKSIFVQKSNLAGGSYWKSSEFHHLILTPIGYILQRISTFISMYNVHWVLNTYWNILLCYLNIFLVYSKNLFLKIGQLLFKFLKLLLKTCGIMSPQFDVIRALKIPDPDHRNVCKCCFLPKESLSLRYAMGSSILRMLYM